MIDNSNKCLTCKYCKIFISQGRYIDQMCTKAYEMNVDELTLIFHDEICNYYEKKEQTECYI